MAKMKNIPEVSTNNFTYTKELRSFTMFCDEASSVLRTSRIYDDACDEGFYLVSEKTGQKILFVGGYPCRNSENEITHWEYTSYCLRENPKDLLDLTVKIWND